MVKIKSKENEMNKKYDVIFVGLGFANGILA
jgi:choline dehydrogenase-like flavoprotein